MLIRDYARCACLGLVLLWQNVACSAEYRVESQCATITIPENWVPLEPAVLAQANAALKASGNADVGSYVAGFRDAHGDSDGFPYLLIQATEIDTQKMRWSAIEKHFEAGAQQGLDATAKGSSIKAFNVNRDRALVTTHIASNGLEWMTFQFYTKDGMVLLHGYERAERMSGAQPTFQRMADSLVVDSGHEFREAGTFDWNTILRTSIVGGITGILVVLFQTWRKRKSNPGTIAS